MSYQKALAVTLNAAPGNDIPRGRFVLPGVGGIALAAANGDAVGVAQEDYDDSAFTEDNGSRAIPVAIEGIVEVESSTAIAEGSAIAVAADGQAKVAATGNTVVGYATDATGAAGEFVSVLLIKPGAAAA